MNFGFGLGERQKQLEVILKQLAAQLEGKFRVRHAPKIPEQPEAPSAPKNERGNVQAAASRIVSWS